MERWLSRGIIAVFSAALLWMTPHPAQAQSTPGAWHLQQLPDPALTDDASALYLAGDSLTFNAWAFSGTSERLIAQGWALSGFEIHSGMEVWELPPRLEPVIDDVPQTVVIALGMNDLIAGGSVREFRANVRRVLDLLGDRRVVWIGLHSPVGLDLAKRTRAFNRAIAREVKRRPTAVFGNWSRVLDRNPEWVHPDDPTGIHLSVAGSRGLTGLMIRRLRALSDLVPTSARR